MEASSEAKGIIPKSYFRKHAIFIIFCPCYMEEIVILFRQYDMPKITT